MPPSAFELERNSLTRWLSETFHEAHVYVATVPAGFKRPAFLLETPRATPDPVLPAAAMRQVSTNLTYFGVNDPGTGAEPWAPVPIAGRIEAVLQACGHLIPLRDETGAQVDVLRLTVEWAPRSGSDTDLTITIRYRRLVWDRQPELEAPSLENVEFRKV